MNDWKKKCEEPAVQYLLLALEFLLLTVIMATLTGGTGVDWDEAYTHKMITQNSWAGIAAATAADVHPPLYYYIAKASLLLFGDKLRVLAWVSIVPTLLGLAMALYFLKKRWGFLTAALFGFGLVMGPYLLFYSLEIRMYSWMDFFVLGVLLMSREVCEEGKIRYWILLYVFSIGAVYTQYFAALPITVCYLWILITLLCRRSWKQVLPLLAVGAADILSYLPWIKVVKSQLGGNGSPVDGYPFDFSPVSFFSGTFGTNLEYGHLFAMVLFFFAVAMLILCRKRFSGTELSFTWMLFLNIVFCIAAAQYIGSLNGHFFSLRYIIYCVMMIWMIMAIVYPRVSIPGTAAFAVWALLIGLSSYVGVHANEYDTTPLMPRTEQFIQGNIAPDAIMVYDYSTFDVLYEYYMPGHQYIFFEDLDLDAMRGKTFWFIQLGGSYFDPAVKEKYGLQIEHYSGFGFMGMEKFELEKVTVPNS